MVKSKFKFFQIQDKKFACQSVEFCKSSFRKTPKTLDSIYVTFAMCKFVMTAKHTVVIIPVQNQPIERALVVVLAVKSSQKHFIIFLSCNRSNACISYSLTISLSEMLVKSHTFYHFLASLTPTFNPHLYFA